MSQEIEFSQIENRIIDDFSKQNGLFSELSNIGLFREKFCFQKEELFETGPKRRSIPKWSSSSAEAYGKHETSHSISWNQFLTSDADWRSKNVSTGRSLGSQKKVRRSSNRPSYRNYPLAINTDHIGLILQSRVSNSNRAKINDNISQSALYPSSLSATRSAFDGKSEKFEFNCNFFETSCTFYNLLYGGEMVNYSLWCVMLRCRSLKTSGLLSVRTFKENWAALSGRFKNPQKGDKKINLP